MRNRPHIFWSCIVIATLIVLAGARHRLESSAHDRAEPETAVKKLEQAAARQAAARLARLSPAPPAPRAQVGGFSWAEIASAYETFHQMLAVQGLITRDKVRQDSAAKLLATPYGSKLVRQILLDPEFARAAFGEFQAEARYLSIAVLGHAARNGDLALAASTAAELGAQLAGAKGVPDHGRDEDLIDITSMVARAVGSQAFAGNSPPLLAALGFTNPDLPTSVRGMYLRGIFDGVWQAETIEHAQTTIERLRKL